MSEELREKVRERYAEAARGVKEEGEGCCSSSCCGTGPEARRVDLTAGSYSDEELTELPAEAVGASLGCGNPAALATLSAGEVDVVTSGNHGWDGPEAAIVHRHPRVLRPHNVPEGVVGKGMATLEVEGEPVSVLNLGSRTAAMPGALPVYESWLAARLEGTTTVVDFHSDSAWEKMEFATAVDGRVAAVMGTHTHEPTINLHILPGGTSLVADVGMTGPSGNPGGFPLQHFAARMRGEDPASLPPFELATGPVTLGAVWLRIERGRTLEIERIS